MSVLSFFENKEEVALLVDIGSGSISSALVLFSKDKNPELIYNVRLPFSVGNQNKSPDDASGLASILETTLSELIRLGFGQDYFKNRDKKASSVLVSFSSPRFVSKTKRINIEKEKDFVITKNFLDSIVAVEEDIYKKELLEQDGGKNNTPRKIIEKNILHIKINGYTVEEGLGKTTNALEAFVSFSATEQNICDTVYKNIFKQFHIESEKVFFHTFPIISFSVIRDIVPSLPGYIMLDVSGEVTELSLVNDNVVINTVSFPSGRNFIIRQIAKTFDFSPEIAESTLRLYSNGKVNMEIDEKMTMLFSDIEKEWSIYFENALLELSATMNLPSNIYITADKDVAEHYINFLKVPKADESMNFRNNLSITQIDQNFLSKFYTSNPRLPEDEFIALLSIFYKKTHKTDL